MNVDRPDSLKSMDTSRVIESNAEFSGETEGPITIAPDATVVIRGQHRGSIGVSGGGTLFVQGEVHGALTLESLATATISGDLVGSVDVRVAGTLVIEAEGRVAGTITNYGSCTNRGLRSGRVDGRVPDDQPGSVVLEPSNGGAYPPLPTRA